MMMMTRLSKYAPPPLPLFLETDVAGQLRLSIPLGACVCLSRFCANDARFELSGN